MKTFAASVISLMALSACVTPQPQAGYGPAATVAPQTGLANPASVHCKEQGNMLEIRTAADGSQTGMCMFPDGSACEEWSYLRGACGPALPKTPPPATLVRPTTSVSEAKSGYIPPGTSEKIVDWWGVIRFCRLLDSGVCRCLSAAVRIGAPGSIFNRDQRADQPEDRCDVRRILAAAIGAGRHCGLPGGVALPDLCCASGMNDHLASPPAIALSPRA